ncbi:MAG: protein kinase domain-containing protein [Gemmatimonadota bacterium]
MKPAERICPSCSTPLPDVAAFCYVCGTATPTAGIDRSTGEMVAVAPPTGTSADIRARLQRALGTSYHLGEMVGSGGFAEVYHCRDLRLKRDVAVKVLRPDLVLSQSIFSRFRREAEAIAALRHPNIVPIYDIGEGGGLAWIIMPLIKGESLKAVIDREGQLPVPEVTRILREAAGGLAVAHEAGVIHRDIKPENIMLEGPSRRVLLMDFGIAKAVDSMGDHTLTSTGIIVGTPHYMSPEQASGERQIDARSDQYSLAVVGFRMLTGRLPFVGSSTRTILYKQLVETPPPVQELMPDVPAALADALNRALSKEPEDRFPTVEEFAQALRAPPGSASGTVPTGFGRAALASAASRAPVAAAPAAKKKRSNLLWYGAGAAALLGAAVMIPRLKGSRPSGATSPASAAIDTARATMTPPPPVAIAAPDSAPQPARTAAAPAPVRRDSAPGARRIAKPAPSRPLDTAPATAGGAVGAARRAVDRSCAALVQRRDWSAALQRCEVEARQGNALARRYLGTMYEEGNGVVTDLAAAAQWYEQARILNDGPSMFRLGRMTERGQGVPANAERALSLYRGAADLGYTEAQVLMGDRYANGDGVTKDREAAVAWYRRAADAGSAKAQLRLADAYQRGDGVPKSEQDAVKWITKAAEQGDAQAQFRLFQAFDKGKGIDKNQDSARQWLEKACRQEPTNKDCRKL